MRQVTGFSQDHVESEREREREDDGSRRIVIFDDLYDIGSINSISVEFQTLNLPLNPLTLVAKAKDTLLIASLLRSSRFYFGWGQVR